VEYREKNDNFFIYRVGRNVLITFNDQLLSPFPAAAEKGTDALKVA
jgi:hypothetical protein